MVIGMYGANRIMSGNSMAHMAIELYGSVQGCVATCIVIGCMGSYMVTWA